MASTPMRQSDELKLAEIITQINPDYRPAPLSRMKQWLFAFCSCFQPHEVSMERLCQGDEFLLPPSTSPDKKTLVLDLDETLVHSIFTNSGDSDFSIPVDIGGRIISIYVRVRPGVEQFLARAAQLYEVVVYTASLSKYADPLLDKIDPQGRIAHRLFRESCTMHLGSYIKDLGRLGRDLRHVLIIDVNATQNSPTSYAFHPENALPITSWYEDKADRELETLLPALKELTSVEDVRVAVPRALALIRAPEVIQPSSDRQSDDQDNSSPRDEKAHIADRSFSLPKRQERRRSLNVERGDFNSPLHSEGKHFEWSLSETAKL